MKSIGIAEQRRGNSHARIHANQQQSVDLYRQGLNLVGCVIASYILIHVIFRSPMPLTLDILLSIFLAEYCRWRNNDRRRKVFGQVKLSNSNSKAGSRPCAQSKHRLDTIVSVVGFREEATLFTKALQSYHEAENCRFLLACIDGDAKEDQDMVNVFEKVYPENSALLHFDVPLADIALQMDQTRTRTDSITADQDIIAICCSIARKRLEDVGIEIQGPNAVKHICVSQPHRHKKGIMFTSIILSMVISEMLGIEYLWTSDSDSMIQRDTLTQTMALMASDPTISGASTALYVHNKDETLMTQLGNAVYINELYLARSFSGSVAANDCQSGPCAAFRVSALHGELLAWYKQKVFGHWMITNEDRHLTTCLLARGWKVVFAADILTATESPTTLRRWLLQQVRWSRAVHIESVYLPRVYIMQSPLLFFGALRRIVAAFLFPAAIIIYFFTGSLVFTVFSLPDFCYRFAITLVYLALRNPYRPSAMEWFWSIPASVLYNITWPAIQVWSFATLLSDSWGTSMRSTQEISRLPSLRTKVWDLGFFCAWMGVIGGILGRYVVSTWGITALNESTIALLATMPPWLLASWWMLVTE